GGLESDLGSAGCLLACEELCQRLECELAQPRALDHEPLLKGGLLHYESLEQVSMIGGRRLRQGLRRASHHQSLESRHIDLDSSRIESQARSVGLQAPLDRGGKRLAKCEEGLAQVGSGLSLTHLPPEEGSQLVAWMGRA